MPEGGRDDSDPEAPLPPPGGIGRWARWRRRWRSRKVLVKDHSMEPALRPGDRLWLDPLAYRTQRPRRGDVIVVLDPADLDRLLLKRVVGTPGDFVRITQSGAQRVPSRSDPGLPPPGEALEELEVPPEHLFVLSDRPARTRDSRQFGPVPFRSVAGQVWYRYHPTERRGPI